MMHPIRLIFFHLAVSGQALSVLYCSLSSPSEVSLSIAARPLLTLAVPSSSSTSSSTCRNTFGDKNDGAGVVVLTLQPMLGRHLPHRATYSAPSADWCSRNLDSIVSSKTATAIRTTATRRVPFVPGAPVHILRSAWTPALCRAAIDAADKHDKWSTWRHHLYPTTDIPAIDLPNGVGDATLALAQQVILPCIASAFDTPIDQLHFKDMFLAKYEPTGQPGLGRHTDGSAYSFNMLLSDPQSLDFEGGGTWIEPVGLVKPEIGDILMHRGSLLHEGCPVIKGSRYVLVGFVQSDDKMAGLDSRAKEDGNKGIRCELLFKTVPTFPLGMVIEVDEGDAVSCVMVVSVAVDEAACAAGVRVGDCIRGILIAVGEDEFVSFDGKSFDHVMGVLVGRKSTGSVSMVVERWCSSM